MLFKKKKQQQQLIICISYTTVLKVCIGLEPINGGAGGWAGLMAFKFHRSPVTGCADAEGARWYVSRKHIVRSPPQ